MIPFTNLKLQQSLIKDQLTPAFTKTVDSGWYILGDQLKEFEVNFAKYIGCKYYAGVASGTDAITIALMALGVVDNWNTRRNSIANYYISNLQNVELLITSANVFHNYHLFVVKHPQRNSVIEYLSNKGVQSLIHYPVPINLQNAFNYQKDEELIKSRRFANCIFSLPMYPELEDFEVEMIVKTINLYESYHK
jgi:dTDP-4-amino-4,6-dideoxygalactose transaminase